MRRASRVVGFLRHRFGRGPLGRARREEALGRLEAATALYLQAGAPDQAARVLALRVESARDPSERLRLLSQAAELTTGDAATQYASRSAELALDLAAEGTRVLLPSELDALGKKLEGLGKHELAARAFGLAGDVEAEARSLVLAGDVDRLEAVLNAEQRRRRVGRTRALIFEKLNDLDRAGRRREALEMITALPAEAAADEALASLRRAIELRCCRRDPVSVEIDGLALEVVFGDRLRIGRSDVNLVVASPAVSRAHLEVRRGKNGPEVCDLGSHNGTWLAGARIGAPVDVGAGLEVSLGAEVQVRFTPWNEGGVRCEIGDRAVCAPLGALEVGVWKLDRAEDGELELSADVGTPVVLGDLGVTPPLQLCCGDVLREQIGGPARLRVLG